MIKRYFRKRDNPLEVVAVAFLFLLPGVALVVHKGPVLLFSPRMGRGRGLLTVLSPLEAQIFGWWAIGVGVALVGLYFYARYAIAREETAPPPHFLDLE